MKTFRWLREIPTPCIKSDTPKPADTFGRIHGQWLEGQPSNPVLQMSFPFQTDLLQKTEDIHANRKLFVKLGYIYNQKDEIKQSSTTPNEI